ncbi:PstA family ABC transporter permease [Caminicella sporogenes]|uniref:PstA family ABC transporter permease n=1 Tax=Caminicella sporogenes TaxID=166485 RepID=UPI002540CDBE|nr:ABC transporter permease subunit [Caminicella sporogenes]WIF93972.1 ABC transporter permease subunit [Caminicella sporogenes]
MSSKKHLFIKIWTVVSGLLFLTVVIYIFGFIIIKGINSISYKFIIEKPDGFPLGTEGGIFPAIVGSICFTLVAVIFALITAFATSVYIVFYEKNEKVKSFIRFIIGTIAGIPSIVLGLFGYSFLIVYLNLEISILTGGIVLGIMIFPFIEVRFEKSFLEVNRGLIEASYSMGVNKFYTIFNMVLPVCYRDMLSAISMAGSLAMGATAPILFTGAVIYAPVPKSLFSPAMALPMHLYILISEGISLKNAYGTALVLLMLLLIMNGLPVIFSMWKGED